MDIDFSEWLLAEIQFRGLSQSELARKAGLSRQAISDYINRKRSRPDEEALKKIAKGLKLPIETVYRAAGILPPEHSASRVGEEIARYKIGELNDQQLDQVLQFIEFLQEQEDKNRKLIVNKNREGVTPPEVVKK